MANNKNIKAFLKSFNPTEEQGEKMFREILRKAENKPQERTLYMKQKLFKSVAIAAAVVILYVTSAFAAVHFDVLKSFFMGDFAYIQNHVKTPYESVSDGRFKLTVNEVLADQNRIYMVFSIEGLTDDAIAELMHTDPYGDFMEMDTITFSQKSGVNAHNYSVLSEIKDKRTNTTRYWAYYDKFNDAIQSPFTLRLNKMSGEQSVTVPTDCNLETMNLTLTGQPYGDVFVNISPIGITVEKGVEAAADIEIMFTDVFFRMQNGKIKTYNQLTSLYKSGMLTQESAMASDEERAECGYLRYKYDAGFFSTIPLSDFKSIIVGNIEYDMKDPTKTSYVSIDKKLYPFEQPMYIAAGGEFFAPIDEVCEKLGASIEWNDEKKVAMIKYHGRTVEVSSEKDTYIEMGNGQLYRASTVFHNGKLNVDTGTLLYGLNVWVTPKTWDKETGEFLPPEDCFWVISP